MRSRRLAQRIAVVAGLVAAVWSWSAAATDGTRLIGIGAQQKGTGGAGVASPKDMTWVLMNPASIVDVEARFDFSFEVFAPYRTIKPDGLFGYNAPGRMSDSSVFYIPAMGYSWTSEGKRYAFGVGLYGVSGMGVDYRRPRSILPPLFFKNFDRRTEYAVASLVVAGAYRFDNGWTVGFAPHLGYSRFKSDMLTLRFRQTKGSDDWDDALGAGFSLGVYKDFGRFSLGAAYTSPRWFQEFEDYDDLFFDSMDLPQNIQAGVAYDIRDDLELALDYKWINWSGVDQVAEDPLQGGFGWEDQHIVKAGLTWEVNEAWKLRTGVSHGNSPIEEEVVFANALFPAITETHLAAGATYAFDEKHAVHFTYMHAFENELTDSGRGDLFSKLGRGTEISLKEDTFTVQYSLKF